MSWLDISTYISLNGEVLVGALSFATFILFLVMVPLITDNLIKSKGALLIVAGLYSAAFAVGLPSFIPSHGKILQVKIERIKNEAVSKENIDKGIETLERIGKKLECKYIGCKKETK